MKSPAAYPKYHIIKLLEILINILKLFFLKKYIFGQKFQRTLPINSVFQHRKHISLLENHHSPTIQV